MAFQRNVTARLRETHLWFEVLTVVVWNAAIFWDIAPCSSYVNQINSAQTLDACWFLARLLEVIRSFEMSVYIRTTRRYIPENGNIQLDELWRQLRPLLWSSYDLRKVLHALVYWRQIWTKLIWRRLAWIPLILFVNVSSNSISNSSTLLSYLVLLILRITQNSMCILNYAYSRSPKVPPESCLGVKTREPIEYLFFRPSM
jgi:hypothetical protein